MHGIAAHLLSAPLAFANQRVEPGAQMKRQNEKVYKRGGVGGGGKDGPNIAKGNFCAKLNSIPREKYLKTFLYIGTFPLRPRIHWANNTGELALR